MAHESRRSMELQYAAPSDNWPTSTMQTPARLYSLTATEVIGLIKENTITVEEYACALLSRIENRDDMVKAWEYLNKASVLSQARSLDQVPHAQRGPLHGAAIAIKDVMDTKDMPTTYGSAFYQGHRPDSDASAVAILRNAGALIFGKTTTTEFTIPNAEPNTTNPHDPNRTPGGSSAGSAAAVADCQVPLSLGTQTGGSVIRPASYTGVFAIKASWNSLPLEGIKPVSTTIDSLGVFARSIEDLQLVLDAFALGDEGPPRTVSLKQARVALMRSPIWLDAGPGTIAAMEKAANILSSHGVQVEEVTFPSELRDATALKMMHNKVFSAESRVSFLKEYQMDKSKISKEIRDLVENKSRFTRDEALEALDQYASMRPIFDKIAGNFSAIITPSAIDEAPLGIDDMGDPAFNFLWTGLHMPVVNVPAFVGTHGMPIGISMVTGRCFDQDLLRISTVLSEPLMAEGGWKVANHCA